MNFVQIKSLELCKEKIEHYAMLYCLTKHSKKKAKHLKWVGIWKEVYEEMKEEYGSEGVI